jgi:hypothetical protein
MGQRWVEDKEIAMWTQPMPKVPTMEKNRRVTEKAT